eukprot:5237605-Pleurochrysis_carterae.AAC.2
MCSDAQFNQKLYETQAQIGRRDPLGYTSYEPSDLGSSGTGADAAAASAAYRRRGQRWAQQLLPPRARVSEGGGLRDSLQRGAAVWRRASEGGCRTAPGPTGY